MAIERSAPGDSYNGTDVIGRETLFERLPEILTVEEVGHYLRVGRNSAYDLVKRDELKAVRVSPRRLIVTKTALGAFLGMSNTTDAGTPKGS
jgi:excisionase family DNA binding protein